MKLNKSILAVALGLSVASLSQAGEVFFTGSTAMRNTVYSALTNPGTVFISTPVFTGYGGKGRKDNYMAFYGTLVGGSTPTTINCTWSGSEDGIEHVAKNATINQTFMADALIQTSSSVDNAAAVPPSTQDQPCDLAMADNAQAFSRTTTPTLNNGAEVGVITFEWVRNNGIWQGTNVTDSQIQAALLGGAKRAVFTGNAADTNDYVYASGRDSGSGTRVNALGDCGFGILTSPKQIVLDSSGNMTIVSYTTNHLGGVTTNYIGDYGFSSGGTLAGTLGGNTTTKTDFVHNKTGFSDIAYLGVSDADTAVAAGATVCSYNGVPFSPANVIEGAYTYWGNEYIYEANSVTSGSEADTIYQLLSNPTTGITAFCDGRTAIKLGDMHCTRSGPNTAPPVHN